MWTSTFTFWQRLVQAALVILAIALHPQVGLAQEASTYDISCQVERVAPHLTISKPELLAAESITDLTEYYKPEWVAEYIRVNIATSHNGKEIVHTAPDDKLTAAQKESFATMDNGGPVTVSVTYIPDNTLSIKEEATHEFALLVDPDREAMFPGGNEKLKAYLDKYQLTEKASGVVAQYLLSAVSFTVDSRGNVVDVKMAQTTENEDLDKLLVDAACNMPQWTPATYADGTTTEQDFVLSLGDRSSCLVNVLNIKRD